MGDKTQTIGSIFNAVCAIEEGSFPVFFEWLKNAQTLKPGPDVNYKIDNSKALSTLMIENIGQIDQGNYTCIAKNADGSDSQNVVLNIRGNCIKLI